MVQPPGGIVVVGHPSDLAGIATVIFGLSLLIVAEVLGWPDMDEIGSTQGPMGR